MDENGKKRPHIPMIDFSDATKRTRWVLRVVSIILALTLWFFVGWDNSGSRTKEITVPLRYLDIPDGYSLSNRVRSVTVLLEGNLESLALLDRNAVTASVSLQELRPGKYRLPIHINNPERVRVLSSSPQVIEFELYRIIERTLKPLLEVTDEVPGDVSVTEVAFEPAEVVIKGSEAEVMAVRHAVVRSTLDNLMARGTLDLPVVLLGENEGEIAGLEVVPPRLRMSVRVAEPVEEIRVPVNVPMRGTPGNGLNIAAVVVSPDAVTLRGTRTALANIAEVTLNPIDVTGHTEDMVVDIPLDVPAQGITIADADSVRVEVRLHSPVDTRTFFAVPIAVSGKEVSADWQVSPAAANVTLERPIAAAESFDPDKPPFELYVDVTNIVTDRLVLPLLVRNLRDGMKVIRIEPQQVTVSAVRD